MSTSITNAFIRQYESEVHTAYQRKGSMLRGLVRLKTGVQGESTTFQKIGTGVAGTKSRHGLVPVMNVDHSTVTVTLADYYAGEWVDKLDELKINIDERQHLANAGAYALGRKTDELIITALATSTTTTSVTLTSQAAIRNGMLKAVEDLLERDVPADRLIGVVSPGTWSFLMTVPQFASADFVGGDLPFKNPSLQMKSWLGVNWAQLHTGLPIASNVRTNFIFHPDCVALAEGQNVTVDVTWHGDRASHFINCMMSQGVGVIDVNGIQEVTVDESAALPTS